MSILVSSRIMHCRPGFALLFATVGLSAGPLWAEPEPLRAHRVDGPITVDGVLDEATWKDATAIDAWWETNPGDNVEPKVATRAWLAYDDQHLYVAMALADPEPERIRAPWGDRDQLPSYTDYAGLIVDPRADGKTAQMFLTNAKGIQYDAINSDVTGEDSSPDFFWTAAGKVTAEGWVLEIGIPFSSLRYSNGETQTWRAMLYRNRPREFRYQMFSSRMPREVSCFVCNARPLEGLEGLPSGGHVVVAPFVAATQASAPEAGLGSRLATDDPEVEPGIDVKWTPGPDIVIDATLNPDFSQVESDVPQISSNERFALFFPEKRPFFLEAVDLFATPLQAVYTRTFTAPRWGGRATVRHGRDAFTVLAGEDRGGGSVILPGAQDSDFAAQDFDSTVLLGRYRRDVGERSFLSFLVSDREVAGDGGGGSNRVLGPDFQWRPNDQDWITAQLLWSESETPNRPDLADEWDGRELSGHAAFFEWWHGDGTLDWWIQLKDVAEGFRADNGFIPQVGYRRGYGETGYVFRPEGRWLNRIRPFVFAEYQTDRGGGMLARNFGPGIGVNGQRNSALRVRWFVDDVTRSGRVLSRDRLVLTSEISPTRVFSFLSFNATLGREVDFVHDQPGHGGTLSLSAHVRPTDRLQLVLDASRRWLDVAPPQGGAEERLLTSTVTRLRATYGLSARTYLRVIGQWIESERDLTIFGDAGRPRSGSLSGSALFAWKLDWQTVVFVGYGDERALDAAEDLQKAGNQVFVKVSYAWQR